MDFENFLLIFLEDCPEVESCTNGFKFTMPKKGILHTFIRTCCFAEIRIRKCLKVNLASILKFLTSSLMLPLCFMLHSMMFDQNESH